MLKTLFAIVLASIASKSFSQSVINFRFDDSLSLAADGAKGYTEHSLIGGMTGGADCTKPQITGIAYKNSASGMIDKVTFQDDSDRTQQTLYLFQDTLYKIVLNKLSYYKVNDVFYQESADEVTDTSLLKRFSKDLEFITVLKRIL